MHAEPQQIVADLYRTLPFCRRFHGGFRCAQATQQTVQRDGRPGGGGSDGGDPGGNAGGSDPRPSLLAAGMLPALL